MNYNKIINFIIIFMNNFNELFANKLYKRLLKRKYITIHH
jgi:hypothetical protein